SHHNEPGCGTSTNVSHTPSNPVLTHMGVVRCNMHTGALVPRRSTVAGVPGPRRSADECDAGWFAPVATRRRSILAGLLGPGSLRARSFCPGGDPPDPHGKPWLWLSWAHGRGRSTENPGPG